MTVRWLAAAVTLAACLFVAAMIVAEPEIVGTAVGKVFEGGMWTALAAFILGAAVLGVRRRGTGGRPPTRRR